MQKLKVMRLQGWAEQPLAICDENGNALPGQKSTLLRSEKGKGCTPTLEFHIDGIDISMALEEEGRKFRREALSV
jgi:hypothetical protein